MRIFNDIRHCSPKWFYTVTAVSYWTSLPRHSVLSNHLILPVWCEMLLVVFVHISWITHEVGCLFMYFVAMRVSSRVNCLCPFFSCWSVCPLWSISYKWHNQVSLRRWHLSLRDKEWKEPILLCGREERLRISGGSNRCKSSEVGTILECWSHHMKASMTAEKWARGKSSARKSWRNMWVTP